MDIIFNLILLLAIFVATLDGRFSFMRLRIFRAVAPDPDKVAPRRFTANRYEASNFNDKQCLV